MTRLHYTVLRVGLTIERYRLKAIIFVNNIRIAVGYWRIRRIKKKIERLQKLIDDND